MDMAGPHIKVNYLGWDFLERHAQLRLAFEAKDSKLVRRNLDHRMLGGPQLIPTPGHKYPLCTLHFIDLNLVPRSRRVKM
mmetsp:Transcript_5836/g.11538  ORF Transcript_5836/g.11538 Transcript_5836/m.11538 type:complete len:80 (+) Transcript_5836:1924-2163(+)